MKTLVRCGGLLVLFAAAAALSTPANADAPAGSFRSIMAAKSPGTFGTPAPAAEPAVFESQAAPATGAFMTIMAAKSAGTFGPHLQAADLAQPDLAVNDCEPRSFASIMAAKLPPNARPGNPELYAATVKCQGSAGLW